MIWPHFIVWNHVGSCDVMLAGCASGNPFLRVRECDWYQYDERYEFCCAPSFQIEEGVLGPFWLFRPGTLTVLVC